MTRSEEESSSLALLEQLRGSDESASPTSILTALRTIKHRLIGHDQNKELFVRLGIIDLLSNVLGHSGDSGQVEIWSEARVEAGIAVGSLAYGGEPYIVQLISSNILTSLTQSLDPSTAPPKLVLSSLRTLNTMLDTYIQPTSDSDPAGTILGALYTPEVLRNIHSILKQTSGDLVAQHQISLAASLIAKSCGRQTHHNSNEACENTVKQQDLLAETGVLDALAARVGAFYVAEREKKSQKDLTAAIIPPQEPPNSSLAPVLEAIAAIIQGSQLHCIELLFSPALLDVFPYSTADGESTGISKSTNGASNATSIYLPNTASSFGSMQPPQQIITPAAFPPLSAAHSAHFPPLSLNMLYRSRSSSRDHSMHDTAAIFYGALIGGDEAEAEHLLGRRGSEMEEESKHTISAGSKTPEKRDNPKLDIEESELIAWLISQVRTGDSITRLAAASVLTNLAQAGLVQERLVSVLALLVVPILVQMLDKDAKGAPKNPGYGTPGVGGVDAQTWSRWQVEETAPAVLSRLVHQNEALQKAAVESNAIKHLADLLKRACRTPSDSDDPINSPIFNHRMRAKDATMRCLVNLGLWEEDYRKKIIDANVITTVVNNCLKPMNPISSPLPPDQSNSEGNPPNVLIAACNVARSVSRSVGTLRTSLIDAGIAIPIFSLLHHEDIEVRTAACACICNLVLEFAPMRRSILNSGAIEVLSELAKSPVFSLKLNALWALRHMVLDADVPIKRRCFEGLGVDFLMSLIDQSGVLPDADDDMQDSSDDNHPVPAHFPPKAADAIKSIRKRNQQEESKLLKQQDIMLKAQGLDFFRNLMCGPDVGILIDHVFSLIPADRILDIIENVIAEAAVQSGDIVNAAVYLLCHICAGQARHRALVAGRERLMRELLGLWNHRVRGIRSGVAWILINLTWSESGEEVEAVKMRVAMLRRLGWAEKLREMRKDGELDVRERVKTVEHQMEVAGGGVGTSGGREMR